MRDTVFPVDVKASSTPRRRLSLVLLAVLALMATSATSPHPVAAETGGAAGVEAGPTLGNSPFDRQGMWVWYLSRSEGGSSPAMIARAKRNGIGTVYIKAGDGDGAWGQFTPSLVQALHRGGLDVCAWQFVYGGAPVAEARVGIGAVKKGADCLVIDAEGDYEGKYAAADLYVRTLRAAIGKTFPVSLAGFPYVDYHPAFPYSVFFGPGGAQYNQPQMYWKTIGTSVRVVYEHTYLYNRIWGHPIYPVGQTYEGPSKTALRLFRRFAASYGGLPPSWWDWQETSGPEWGALGARSANRPVTGYQPEVIHPLLKPGSKGDMVVWAQERLIGSGAELTVNGIYGRRTVAAAKAFQEAHGLAADGRIGTSTWDSLLDVTPYRMQWSASQARTSSSGAVVSRGRAAHRPLSASLAPKADEIRPGGP
jgi:putative peptidoglycan binding protein